MTDILKNIEFWKIAAGLVWPLVLLIMFFSLYGKIGGLFEKETFSIKVAGLELNAADAAKKTGEDLAQAQKRIAAIEQLLSDKGIKEDAGPKAIGVYGRVLWVDDYPSNNAFVIDRLQKDGITTTIAISTKDALRDLNNAEFDFVISDLGRREDGVENPWAGVDFIKQARAAGYKRPMYIYAGTRGLENRDKIIQAGGTGVTDNPIDLLQFVPKSVGKK